MIFRTLGPIYDVMFTALRDEFAISENPDNGIFKTCQSGLHFKATSELKPTEFPWAFMEFGSITPVEAERMPQVFRYELTYPMVLMTFADRGNQDRLVFNPDKANAGEAVNKNPGIGDMVASVSKFFWETYHTSRFGVFDSDDDYTIHDWTVSRVGTPTVSQVQAMLVHPYLRAVQLDFTFDIRERTV